jgi:cbb3-type cytochrome oxidase maturation protein
MFADSLLIVLLMLALGVPALVFLFWAVKRGQFDNLDEASAAILDESDLQTVRPWENVRQAQERAERYGQALNSPQVWSKWL